MINLLLIGDGKFSKYYQSILNTYSNISYTVATRNYKEILNSKQFDGVCIITLPDSHVEIAKYCLDKNLKVMIEKPLSLSYSEAQQLKKYDQSNILVNNLHLFSPAYEKMCELIDPNYIKEIQSTGINLTPNREYSALWDYCWHDIYLSLYLTKQIPEVKKIARIDQNNGELFFINFSYGNFKHTIISGNGSEEKIRMFKVIMKNNDEYLYNDLAKNKLIKNNKVIEIDKILTLENSIKHFIMNIENNYCDKRFGIELSSKVIEVLEICQIY